MYWSFKSNDCEYNCPPAILSRHTSTTTATKRFD